MLKSPNCLCGPSLDCLRYVHVSLLLGSPELGTALQLWSHQCSEEGKDHPLNLPLRLSTSSATSTLTLFSSCRSEKELFSRHCKYQASTSWESSFLNPISTDSSCPFFGTAPLWMVMWMLHSTHLLQAGSPSSTGPSLSKRPAEIGNL